MTGLLLPLFWSYSAYRIGWADAALTLAIAILMTLGVVLARRREKAQWIKHPTWRTSLIAVLAASALMYAAEYADSYVLHGKTITAHQLRHDLMFNLLVFAGLTWLFRRRSQARSQVL
jgi:cytochrome c oxidase assembly factor CtaG